MTTAMNSKNKNLNGRAIVFSKFNVLIQQFDDEQAEPLYQDFTLGIYFDAAIINNKITEVKNVF
jgi:hypothetical protein